MDILLKEPIPNVEVAIIPDLIIDDDLMGDDARPDSLINDSIVIKRGTYPFNFNIGNYGGFRINIQ